MYKIEITAREASILKRALQHHLYSELDDAELATEGLTGEGVQSLVDSVRADFNLINDMQALLDTERSEAPAASAGSFFAVPGTTLAEGPQDADRAAGVSSAPKGTNTATKRKR